ncbi:MAG TPA: arginine--tRNA ligase [Candidatus Ratteibacteria bacterium]|nr:arginine--tRNA ligase [Candidatus Ratteibacteria bacterium]
MKKIKKRIEEGIKKVIEEISNKVIDVDVFPSEKENFGDFTTNIVFKLGNDYAEKIREKILPIVSDIVEKIEIKNNYINFFVSKNVYFNFLKELVKAGKDVLKSEIGRGENVLIEFVSANPTGPLTIAHGRQASFGEALSRIMKFANFSVVKEFYINDSGKQIDLLGESLKARYYQLKGEQYTIPEEGYHGEYLIQLAKEIKEEKVDDEFFKKFAYERILEEIKRDLKNFGVEFDSWVNESIFIKEGKVDKIINELKENGYIYFKDGSWWFKSTDFGDDKDRVIIKSDGTYTYLATDIAYHKYKIERNFSILINIVGPDHHGYIPRMKAAVQAMGFNPEKLKFLIVQLTTLYKGKEKLSMSTRKGEFISLKQLIDEVGPDASKFFFLFRKVDSHLDFDIELAKKQSTENPVFYLQYAYVRIKHILNFAESKNITIGKTEFDPDYLKEEEELILLKKMWKFPDIIESVVKTYGVHLLCEYLLNLAKIFHSYYHKYRVVGEDKKTTESRLFLIKGLYTIFSLSLDLLNISLLEEM